LKIYLRFDCNNRKEKKTKNDEFFHIQKLKKSN